MPIEILAYEETPLGILCLRRRELLKRPGTLVTEVTLNHEFLMSSYLTESERTLTRIGLEMVCQSAGEDGVAPDDSDSPTYGLSVLVGGLGLGYTATEALDDERVATVEVVEFLPQVIGWLRDGVIPLSDRMNGDDRLTVSNDDVYDRLGRPFDQDDESRFDLIAIDVDHSPEDVLGEQSKEFYSVDGLQTAATHLCPGGVFAVWSYAEDTPFLDSMKAIFDDVRTEEVTVMNDLIDVEQTDWLFFGRRRTG